MTRRGSSFRIRLLFPHLSPLALPLRFYLVLFFVSLPLSSFISISLLHFRFLLLLSPLVLFPILLFPVALLDLLSHSSFPYSGDDDLPIATKRNAGAGMAIFAFACNAFIHTVVEFSAIHCFPDYFIVAFESSFGGVTD